MLEIVVVRETPAVLLNLATVESIKNLNESLDSQNAPLPASLPLSQAPGTALAPLPSDSSFSALIGLVGDPVEDFLPLSPDIIAIEESLPMALTALPVFWKIDTEVGLRQWPWFQQASPDEQR